MQRPTDRSAPIVEHWREQEIAQWVHHEGSIHETSLYHGALSRSPESHNNGEWGIGIQDVPVFFIQPPFRSGVESNQLNLASTFRASCYITRLSWTHTPVIRRVV